MWMRQRQPWRSIIIGRVIVLSEVMDTKSGCKGVSSVQGETMLNKQTPNKQNLCRRKKRQTCSNLLPERFGLYFIFRKGIDLCFQGGLQWLRIPFPSLRGVRKKNSRRKAAFCISLKVTQASLTVEAALVVPLFLGAILLLLQVLDLYRLQGMLTLSLQESAMELSVMETVLDPGSDEAEENTLRHVVELAGCIAYAQSHLPNEVTEKESVSLLNSKVDGNRLILEANYRPKLLTGFLPIHWFSASARAVVHFFNGRGPGDFSGADYEAVEMVYVTEYESVYHTNASCSHISLSVHEISSAGLSTARNSSGARYTACEKCVGAGETGITVYISDQGTRYHNSISCSGIKRTVRLVAKDQTSASRICAKCGARV